MGFFGYFAVFFVLGTLLLSMTKHKRYFIAFLIRTRLGIIFVDWIARLFPRIWKVLADLGIILAFGGFGGLYLSDKGRRKSLYVCFILLSVPLCALVGLKSGLMYGGFCFFGLSALMYYLFRWGSKAADFFTTAGVLFALGSATALTTTLIALTSFLGFPALILFMLMQHAGNILSGETGLPGVSPLLPKESEGKLGVFFPGYDIFIPWWYALVAISTTLLVHECAHGVLARVHKIKLKSTGLVTVGPLPVGAFVEPDEDEMKTRPSIERMHVFAAGSFANILTSLFALALLLGLLASSSSLMSFDGVEVINVTQGSPAEAVIKEGMVVYEIDGMSSTSVDEFIEATDRLGFSQPIQIKTDRGVVNLTTAAYSSDSKVYKIGIIVVPHVTYRDDLRGDYSWILVLLSFIIRSLEWIIFFNVNIGLINLFPVPPFDGYRMVPEVLGVFNLSEETVNRVLYGIFALTISVFIINLLPLLSMLF